MKITAIVVTYNRVDMLRKCINHLLHQSYTLDSIVIVNNDSFDNTYNYLHKLCNQNKRIIVKNMPKNVGGAGGFNIGMRIAFKCTNSKYFWIMDDDTMPTHTALNKLVHGITKVRGYFGFLCSNVRWGKKRLPCNTPETVGDWDELLPGNLIKVKVATFVSFLCSRETVSRRGLPIAPMFIWGDDFEYSLRLHNYHPCYFVSNSVVIHDTKKSSPNISIFDIPREREIYLEYNFRNKLYAVRKNSDIKQVFKEIIYTLLFTLKVPFHAKKDKLRKMIYCVLGLIKGFFFNPKIDFPNGKQSV